MILMIDNYDSFTFNLVHYFEKLKQDVCVFRNDEITLDDIEKSHGYFTGSWQTHRCGRHTIQY